MGGEDRGWELGPDAARWVPPVAGRQLGGWWAGYFEDAVVRAERRCWRLGLAVGGEAVVLAVLARTPDEALAEAVAAAWEGSEVLRDRVLAEARAAIPRWLDEVSPSGLVAGVDSIRAVAVGMARLAEVGGGVVGGEVEELVRWGG